MSLGPLYVPLGEVSTHILCLFFNWIFCLSAVESSESLYILEIKPLSDVSLANMFSYAVSSLFILIMVSLAMQKIFSLM